MVRVECWCVPHLVESELVVVPECAAFAGSVPPLEHGDHRDPTLACTKLKCIEPTLLFL